MIETVLLILVLIVALGILVFLERRSEKHQAMFTGTVTPIRRLVALVLGLVSTGVFLTSLADGIFYFLPLILALALIGYAFGARELMNRIQGRRGKQDTWKSEEPPEPMQTSSLINDVFRIFIKLGGMIIISAGTIYAVILVVTNPENPLAKVFVVATIIFIVFTVIYVWFKGIIDWFKFL